MKPGKDNFYAISQCNNFQNLRHLVSYQDNRYINVLPIPNNTVALMVRRERKPGVRTSKKFLQVLDQKPRSENREFRRFFTVPLLSRKTTCDDFICSKKNIFI